MHGRLKDITYTIYLINDTNTKTENPNLVFFAERPTDPNLKR